MNDDACELLRELADDLEKDRERFAKAMLLLRNITAAVPWEWDAGGQPAFWYLMRQAQDFIREFDEKGYRTV